WFTSTRDFSRRASKSGLRHLTIDCDKAGIIKLGKTNGHTTPIAMTAQGDNLLAEIPDVIKTTKEKDGTDAYVVPLATRQLAEISKITMLSPERATVQYTGKWIPISLGISSMPRARWSRVSIHGIVRLCSKSRELTSIMRSHLRLRLCW